MSVKKTVIGMGFAIAMSVNSAFAATPQVFLTVVDTVLYPNAADPNGNRRLLTIRMNNPTVHVGAYAMSITMGEPSIINFNYASIDTEPPDTAIFQDCSPPPCRWDTIITCPQYCYHYIIPIDTAGTRSNNFDAVTGRREEPTIAEVTGDAQSGTGPVMQPGNGVLFRIPLIIFPISDTFSLSQRQVEIYFDSIFTYVSDSSGNTLWRVFNSTLSLTHGTVTVPYPMKGDCNFDGNFTPTDLAIELGFIFVGSPQPPSGPAVADVNCDGRWTPADVVLEINKIYLLRPLPC